MLTIDGKYSEESTALDRIVALAIGWREDADGLWLGEPLPPFSENTGWAEYALICLKADIICRYSYDERRWNIEIQSQKGKRKSRGEDYMFAHQGNDWGFARAAALAIKSWQEKK